MRNLSWSAIGALDVSGTGFGMIRNIVRTVGRKWLLILALTCLPGLLFAQPAANYYVATTGSDSNSGTSSTTPFATITHALLQCHGGETVAVASGTYSTDTWTGTQGGVARGAVVYIDATHLFTSMVKVLGWGVTPPLIQGTGPNDRAIYVNGACFLTFDNFTMRSEADDWLVDIGWYYGPHAPAAHDIVIQNCDLSDPDTTDPSQTHGSAAIVINGSSSNVTVQNCHIHDCECGIVSPGTTAPACNNINILNNVMENFTDDAMQFSAWNNVTIDGNTIKEIHDAPGSTIHNDGIQFTGPTQNAKVTHNLILNSTNQIMLIQPSFGPIDNVLVENNVCNNGDIQSQGSTHVAFINNTTGNVWILFRGYNGVVPHDTVIANNQFPSIGYTDGATAAYEDYNLVPKGPPGGSNPSGPHDIISGVSPGFVDATNENFHPAPGSPMFHAGVHSFTATVDGVVTTFNAPTDDLDYITRGNPPTIGGYETTAGNASIAYSGFNYSTTGSAPSLTDGSADYGWVESTWTNSGTIVSPGLTYSTLPVLGDALSFYSNAPSSRTISPSVMPSGYTVTGSDGVTRIGAPGTTIWMSFLIDPTQTQSGSLTAGVHLAGQSVGGSDKLVIGDVTGTTTSWGVGNAYSGTYAYATGAAPITTGTTAFLVVKIQFTTGNSTISMWVNPPLGATPPATPDATLSTVQVGPFNIVQFKGNRTSTADEYSVGTSWLSVTSGGL